MVGDHHATSLRRVASPSFARTISNPNSLALTPPFLLRDDSLTTFACLQRGKSRAGSPAPGKTRVAGSATFVGWQKYDHLQDQIILIFPGDAAVMFMA